MDGDKTLAVCLVGTGNDYLVLNPPFAGIFSTRVDPDEVSLARALQPVSRRP